MRYAVAMSAALPQTIVELPWSADTLTVVNSTTAILYIRVGGRDYPTATNFDHSIPAGVSRTIPVVGGTFALSLYAGPVGALGGASGFTARCDCLFLRDESAPTMSGYQLPPTTLATSLTSSQATTVIDGRGFDSVFLSMGRPPSNPAATYWHIDESSAPVGPWARLAGYAQLYGIGGASLDRHVPVGPGYLRVGFLSTDPTATASIFHRPRPGPADLSLVRAFRTALTTVYTALDGVPQMVFDHPIFAGRLVAVALKLTGLNSSAEPAVEIDVYPDLDYSTYLQSIIVGRVVSPQAPWYPAVTVETGAASPWLMDGDATSRYWYVPVDTPSAGRLRVDIANLSTLSGGLYTLPSLAVALVLDVEI